MKKDSMRLVAALALTMVTIIWGGGFIATQYAIASGMDASLIMALRFLLGALLLGVLGHRRIACAGRGAMARGMAAGLLLFGAYYTQTLGQGRTTVSSAAFITASYVLMTPLIEWALFRRRLRARVLGLCALAMGGVLLLTVDFSAGLAFGAGDLLVMLSAFLFALHIVYLGCKCDAIDALASTFWQLLAAGLAGLALFLVLRPAVTAAQVRSGILPILYLAAFSTCLCHTLQTWGQQHVPPAAAGVILSMEGLFGTLFSLLLGMEALRAPMVLGGAMIMGAVAAMNAGEK